MGPYPSFLAFRPGPFVRRFASICDRNPHPRAPDEFGASNRSRGPWPRQGSEGSGNESSPSASATKAENRRPRHLRPGPDGYARIHGVDALSAALWR
jgi:hypothetical protein